MGLMGERHKFIKARRHGLLIINLFLKFINLNILKEKKFNSSLFLCCTAGVQSLKDGNRCLEGLSSFLCS